MEEQAIPLQPTDTTWSRSPCAAMEESTVQQWMRPGGATAHGEPLQEQPGPELQPMGRSPQWVRKAGGATAGGDLCGAVPEGSALWYGAMLEQCLKPM